MKLEESTNVRAYGTGGGSAGGDELATFCWICLSQRGASLHNQEEKRSDDGHRLQAPKITPG